MEKKFVRGNQPDSEIISYLEQRYGRKLSDREKAQISFHNSGVAMPPGQHLPVENGRHG